MDAEVNGITLLSVLTRLCNFSPPRLSLRTDISCMSFLLSLTFFLLLIIRMNLQLYESWNLCVLCTPFTVSKSYVS